MDQKVTQPVKKRRNSSPVTFGLISVLVGASIFYFFGLPSLKYAIESKSWPSTSCTITKSEVDNWKKDGKTQYGALIYYSYRVEGKKYSSSKIVVNGSSSSSNMSAAKKLVAKYPVGKTVDAFYDPEVPDLAVLIPGPRFGDIALAGFPLLLLIIGLLVLFKIIKPKPSYSNTNTSSRKTDIRDFLKR